MKKHILLIPALLLLFAGFGFAQPVNDLCQNAIAFPSLTLGLQSCQNGTNLSANPEFPYISQGSCQPAGTSSMPSPASDVWYSFVAVGNELLITMNSTLSNANVAVYQGTCGSMLGLGCYTSGNGNIGAGQASFAPLTPGNTYYIQVSGNGVADTANFQLCITNIDNNSICLNNISVNISPQPNSGTYSPGDTVDFCYSVNGYNQQGANWFHGIAINFGAGWQTPPISTTPANSCDGNGNWGWYTTVTSSATGQTAGPGFFYDSNAGGPLDGNPGNNFGDNSSTCTWTFCWTVVVDPNAAPGADLGLDITHYGDGQTGSWSSFSCTQDPVWHFDASVNACPFPSYTATPTCDGLSLGSGTVIPGGTAAPFSYLWANGDTTQTVDSLPAGPINVTVTDTNGCVNPLTIIIPTYPVMQVTAATTPATCNQPDGQIVTSINGGSPTFNYQWFPGGQTTPDLTNIPPGTYSVHVTDNNGCMDSLSVNLISQGGITATIATSNDVSCNGGNDGGATVNVSGTAGPYTYQWYLNGNPVSGQTSDVLSNAVAGNYDVIVSVGGCSDTASVTINEPTLLTLNVSGTDATCNGLNDGTATATPAGGAGNYTYLWTPGSQVSQTATSLFAGTYSVTVTDGNGCTVSGSVTIGEPTQVVANAGPDQSFCAGSGGVTMAASASGGTGSYNYNWTCGNPPCGLSSTTDPSANANPTSTNTYTLTVTDANGCVSAPDQVVVTVVQQPVVDLGNDSTLCEGQYLRLDAGNPGATWSWSTGESTRQINASQPGTYEVTVSYQSGTGLCTASDEITVDFLAMPVVDLPSPVEVCRGESVVLDAGNPGYTYLWSNGPRTRTQEVWLTGTYQVTVYNGHCQARSSSLVNVRPNPDFLFPDEVQQFCLVDNNPAILNGPVGTGYQYLWSNGETSPTISPDQPGVYVLTVTNQYGCQWTDSIETEQYCEAKLFLPNAFTPNGDGLNDEFGAVGSLITSFEMIIFDRWGNVIFKGRDLGDSWDGRINGKPAPEGIYTYVAKYRGYIGTEETEGQRSGTVTLLR